MTTHGRLRVLVVEFTPAGGLFQFSYGLARALAAHGHQVTLLTGDDPEIPHGGTGLELRTVLGTWKPGALEVESRAYRKARRLVRAVRYAVAWVRVVDVVRTERPDAVLWSEWRFPLDGWFVRWLAHRSPEPVRGIVAHEPRPLGEQRGQPVYKSGALLVHALAGAFALMDVVVVLGPSARRELLEAWPVTGEVVEVPHGDHPVLDGRGVSSAADAPPQILFFGTLTRYKGLDLLLDAFDLVRARQPSAELRIVGAPSDDLDLHALQQRVTRTPGATIAPGYVPMDQVTTVFEGARVVALPYHRASQSGVAHLAHSLRRPVVATDVGDLRAVVDRGGVLVPAGNAAAFADALAGPLEDPAQAARLGDAGRQQLDEHDPWTTAAESVGTALADVVRRRHDGPVGTDVQVTTHRLDDPDLEGIWRTLADGRGTTTPFLTWEWIGALSHDPETGGAVRVLVAWQDGDAIGLVPLEQVRKGRMSVVGFPGTGWLGADHHDVVGPPELRGRAATAIVRRLTADRTWALIDLDGMTVGGALDVAINAAMTQLPFVWVPTAGVPCPHVTLDHSADAGPISSSKLRYQVRKGLRDAEAGGGGLEIATDPDRVVVLLDELMTLHRERFGEESAVFATAARQAFHRRAARAMAARGDARMYRLHDADRSLGLIYVLRSEDVLHHYATAFRDVGQSPGVVTLGLALQHAVDEGMREFDLLRGDHEWKLRFATGTRVDRRSRAIQPSLWTSTALAGSAVRRIRRRLAARSTDRGRGIAGG